MYVVLFLVLLCFPIFLAFVFYVLLLSSYALSPVNTLSSRGEINLLLTRITFSRTHLGHG
jgi:hypothetical protein